MVTAMPPTDAVPANDRERHTVELVDKTGAAAGSCSVAEAHTAPGRRHRAFSLLLYDSAGRVLLQQRAAVKTRFPFRWSNTCCGHPAPGQDTATAVSRRLADEFGIASWHTTPPAEVGVLYYYARDPDTAHVEDEWDHVLVATLISGAPAPDEAEIRDYRWIFPGLLRTEIAAHPGRYTPWLPGVLILATRYGRAAIRKKGS
jgi:isopentenyl-diphosphate Delta-isomerase